MTYLVVNSTAALQNALRTATAGETIALAPGNYSNVNLHGITPAGAVTIQSEYASRPAAISSLYIQQSKNLQFKNLVLDATHTVPGAFGGENTWVWSIDNSSNIGLSAITAKGAPGVNLSDAVSALNFEYDSNISVTRSTFTDFHHGVQEIDVNGFQGSYNTFSNIYDDGYRGGGTINVTMTNNTFTNFHKDSTDTDHPDTIQFWTNETTASASNFYIANNTYTRGSGEAVQGIFFRDDHGGLPFINVNITNNNYAGSLWSGIRVIDGKNVSVTNNILTSYTDNWTAVELDNIAGGAVTGNSSFKYIYTNDLYLTVSGNLTTPQVAAPAAYVPLQALGHALPAALPAMEALATPPLGFPWGAIAAPEPGAWLLMMVGVAAVGLLLRRRKWLARGRPEQAV